MRLGVDLPTAAVPVADTVAAARRAEALGFDFVSSTDHPANTTPSNETWTQLTWVAACTARIAVASRVLAAPFRNPVLLAKMAETLHRLSGGRLILGLGAGGSDAELAALGCPPLAGPAKIEALTEAVTVVRGVWTSDAFTFSGRHHTVRAVAIEPRPSAPIPLWLGTFGPRALAITGAYADGWIPSLGYAPETELPAMIERVRRSAVDSGRRPSAVEAILNVEVRIEHGRDHHDGDALVGPGAYLLERLQSFLEMGFDGFNFIVRGPDSERQHRMLAEHVVPALRETPIDR